MTDVRERIRAAVQCRMAEAHVHGASSRKPADFDQFEKDARETADLIIAIVGEWQPIETAPRDKTAILLHNAHAPGCASGHSEECVGHNTVVGEWWSGGNPGSWMCFMDSQDDPECPFAPTHWRPLPEPPQ